MTYPQADFRRLNAASVEKMLRSIFPDLRHSGHGI
jgi:hypothetical protein